MNTIEDILRWLEINGLEFFKVSKSRGDKNDKVYETSSEDNPAERIRKFRDAMKFAPSGYFYITARRNQTATTGLFENEFMNGQVATPAVGGVSPAVSGDFVPKSEVSGLVAAEIEKYETKTRLAQLERENRELQKELDENGGAIGRIVKRAEPIIGLLIERFIPARPSVQLAGIEHETQTTEHDTVFEPVMQNTENEKTELASDEENNRIQLALEKWNAADPEFIQVLEFIADFAATGKTISPFPGVKLGYSEIKGMLK